MYSDTFYNDLDNGLWSCIAHTIEMRTKSTVYSVADQESNVLPVEIPGTHFASSFIIGLN
jgi:hypothetical protein